MNEISILKGYFEQLPKDKGFVQAIATINNKTKEIVNIFYNYCPTTNTNKITKFRSYEDLEKFLKTI